MCHGEALPAYRRPSTINGGFTSVVLQRERAVAAVSPHRCQSYR